MSSATPTGRLSIATKYSHCTSATPIRPNATRKASSRRPTLSFFGATTTRKTKKSTAAAVFRICASSSDDSPEPSTTFDTLPLTAKSVAAVATMA